jgi:hypothetical protein
MPRPQQLKRLRNLTEAEMQRREGELIPYRAEPMKWYWKLAGFAAVVITFIAAMGGC